MMENSDPRDRIIYLSLHPCNIFIFYFQPNEGESLEYELFSVVIHSGGAHGGHYHAYIRDIDQLGTWVAPVSTEN